VELSTHAGQDRELEAVRSQIMQLVLKLERPLYINKRNRQDRSGIVILRDVYHSHLYSIIRF